jgi:Tfp pilus assembly PilM family ATPase
MSLINNRIGLSISEDRIQLVETVRSGDVQCAANVDEEFFDEAISVDTKEAKYIHLLQNAYNEILLRTSISGTILCVTLPPLNFKVFEIPADKNLTKNDLKEYIKWEISRLFPTKSKDYFIFQKIVLNPLHFESTRRVLVFALPAHILRSIHKFSMRNNLQLKYVDHAHTAVYGLLKNEDKNFPVLSLFIDSNLVSFFIFSNENIVNQFSTEYGSINIIFRYYHFFQIFQYYFFKYF